ncbi:MAG: zinc-binding dehydrogenase [Myxococcota bacterium]
MRQICFPRPGPPEVMELREVPDPSPAAGQVRVAVEAAGVNFADVVARQGMYQDAPPFPMVVGYEVAGTIDAVGEGVDAARVGEPVVAMVRFGGYSSSVCVPAAQAIRRPAGLDARTAAAIPVNYTTAWLALRVYARVQAGDRVLIHAAAGGVGLAAVDLCVAAGAEVWGSAGKGKHAFLRERGVAHLLDSHAGEWPDEKLDVVLDAQGGATWARGLDALRDGGKLVMYGVSAMSPGESRSLVAAARMLAGIPWLRFSPISLMNTNKAVCGVNMARVGEDRVAEWLGAALATWEEGKLRPHVHAAVPFAEAPEAHRILHRRENVGKVVLVP